MNASRISIFLITFCIILASAQRSYAQDPLIDGCDPRVRSAIANTTQLPFEEACDAYRTCEPELYGSHRVCLLVVTNVLLAECDVEDRECRTNAFLYTAAIPMMKYIRIRGAPSDNTLGDTLTRLRNLFFPPAYNSEQELPEDLFQIAAERVINTLKTAENGIYPLALYDYARLARDNYGDRDSMLFSKAVIYHLFGATDAALAAYAEALQYDSYNPLPHYGRLLLYSELGRRTEASFEAEWLRQYTLHRSELQSFIRDLTENYPLDTSEFSTWTMYPVLTFGFGSGGDLYTDNSLEEAYPVSIYIDPAQKFIFIREFEGISSDPNQTCGSFNWECASAAFLVKNPENGSYEGTTSNYYIKIEGQDEYFIVHARYCSIDRCSASTFFLAPSNTLNPRTTLPGERCGVLSRLENGMTIQTAMPPGLFLRETPAGEMLDHWSNGYVWEATVISDGICIDDQMWWEITESNGHELTGWVAENEGMSYTMNPVENEAQSAE